MAKQCGRSRPPDYLLDEPKAAEHTDRYLVRTCYMRQSTIEVHPNLSEAPHLGSSIPHPKPDFSENPIASR